jgi:predicted dehydrogenase
MTLRAAVIGLGRQGQRHLASYEKVAEVRVEAVCDLDSARLDECRTKMPGVRTFQSAEDLLRSGRFDLLSIVTLAPTHGSIVATALETGVKRILCEKPISTSLSEGDVMVVRCAASGARLAVNHCRRWWEPYRRLVGVLREGRLGRLVRLHYGCGGGRLGGTGSHAFDAMRMLVGADALSVRATLDREVDPDPRGPLFVDPGGVGEVVFPEGVRATIDMSKDMGVTPVWDITCTDGRVRIDEVAGRWCIHSRVREHQLLPGHRRYSLPFDTTEWQPGSLDMVSLTAEAIRELASESTPSCAGADGLAALELVRAFHVSHAKGGAEVALPLDAAERRVALAIA